MKKLSLLCIAVTIIVVSAMSSVAIFAQNPKPRYPPCYPGAFEAHVYAWYDSVQSKISASFTAADLENLQHYLDGTNSVNQGNLNYVKRLFSQVIMAYQTTEHELCITPLVTPWIGFIQNQLTLTELSGTSTELQIWSNKDNRQLLTDYYKQKGFVEGYLTARGLDPTAFFGNGG